MSQAIIRSKSMDCKIDVFHSINGWCAASDLGVPRHIVDGCLLLAFVGHFPTYIHMYALDQSATLYSEFAIAEPQ